MASDLKAVHSGQFNVQEEKVWKTIQLSCGDCAEHREPIGVTDDIEPLAPQTDLKNFPDRGRVINHHHQCAHRCHFPFCVGSLALERQGRLSSPKGRPSMSVAGDRYRHMSNMFSVNGLSFLPPIIPS